MRIAKKMSACLAAIAALTVSQVGVAPASAAQFDGIVRVGDCSGSFVRFADQRDSDEALILTNGHCAFNRLNIGEYRTSSSIRPKVTVYAGDNARRLGTFTAKGLDYATMTVTDVAIYRTGVNFRTLEQRFGVRALPITEVEPRIGTEVTVPSGYWKRTWACSIGAIIPTLETTKRPGVFFDVVQLVDPTCPLISGTSGSPVVDNSTGEVVALNSTGEDATPECRNTPGCQVEGTNYATQVALLNKCYTRGNLDLRKNGCTLPGGASAENFNTSRPNVVPVPAPRPNPNPIQPHPGPATSFSS